jgi:hypothetical protein
MLRELLCRHRPRCAPAGGKHLASPCVEDRNYGVGALSLRAARPTVQRQRLERRDAHQGDSAGAAQGPRGCNPDSQAGERAWADPDRDPIDLVPRRRGSLEQVDDQRQQLRGVPWALAARWVVASLELNAPGFDLAQSDGRGSGRRVERENRQLISTIR